MSASDEECPDLVAAKVPVTILTGFLGSGKTTLIHHILQVQQELKIAVIVNEFEFGRSIEKGLSVNSAGKSEDEWLEMNNGCMCCSAKNQSVDALERLIQQKGSFDLILIETSGLADPAPVAAMFWQDAALNSVLYLAGVVAVVDSYHILGYLSKHSATTNFFAHGPNAGVKSDEPVAKRDKLEEVGADTVERLGGFVEASQQLIVADRVLLNKVDLVGEDVLGEVTAKVSTINPSAELLPVSLKAERAKANDTASAPAGIDLKALLFLNTTEDTHIPNSRRLDPVPLGAHVHGVTAVSLEFDGAVATPKQIDALATALLYNNEDGSHPNEIEDMTVGQFSVVRMKGALWARSNGCRVPYQLQSIGELYDVQEMGGASVPAGKSRLLVLGRQLDEAVLRGLVAHLFTVEGAE